jgi:hypothetical protein
VFFTTWEASKIKDAIQLHFETHDHERTFFSYLELTPEAIYLRLPDDSSFNHGQPRPPTRDSIDAYKAKWPTVAFSSDPLELCPDGAYRFRSHELSGDVTVDGQPWREFIHEMAKDPDTAKELLRSILKLVAQ